jgi:hypothetical protein
MLPYIIHRVNIEWFESELCTCIIDDVWEHRVNIEWFGSELCTCIIDDVWEHRVITKQHHCVIAHEWLFTFRFVIISGV